MRVHIKYILLAVSIGFLGYALSADTSNTAITKYQNKVTCFKSTGGMGYATAINVTNGNCTCN